MANIRQTLGAALSNFCKNNPELKVSFISDELENYRVKELPKGNDALQVLQSLVAMNPVSTTK